MNCFRDAPPAPLREIGAVGEGVPTAPIDVTIVPDESCFRAFLANDFSLSLSVDNKVFGDWTEPGGHPKSWIAMVWRD